ncbi:MAG TPA: hypothetical protein VLM37_04985, partial [Fibrobacteraceae bacterium]|nr:hypothetical protein [Fibrobacteraceae bacterium]
EVDRFSPLHDDCLPHDCAGLILGGGYPELYAQTLSLNTAIMQSIQRHCAQGMVIYAECGGLMYLSAGIICGDQRHPLLGILPSWVEMGDRLRRLGYVQAQLQQDCPLGQAGEVLHGHEYHYSHLLKEPAGWEPLYLCRDVRGAEPRAEGWWKGDVTASYVHLALEALPQTLDSWVKHCTQKENFA